MGRFINTALGQRWTDEPLPEAHLVHARLKNLEAKIDSALEMAKEVGSNAPSPSYTAEDIQDLAERLAEDRSWLPHGSHVETRAEDNSTPLSRAYGPTYVDRATTVSIPIIGTFTPRELLETGLVTKGGRWNHVRFDEMITAIDGVVKGQLIGPRDLMRARQNEARSKYPRFWHA
jgi:hypothetical protein